MLPGAPRWPKGGDSVGCNRMYSRHKLDHEHVLRLLRVKPLMIGTKRVYWCKLDCWINGDCLLLALNHPRKYWMKRACQATRLCQIRKWRPVNLVCHQMASSLAIKRIDISSAVNDIYAPSSVLSAFSFRHSILLHLDEAQRHNRKQPHYWQARHMTAQSVISLTFNREYLTRLRRSSKHRTLSKLLHLISFSASWLQWCMNRSRSNCINSNSFRC